MSAHKVVVAMSGGVDSSVAACLLHERGYQVVGLFMRTGVQHVTAGEPHDRHRGCCSAADASDARYVAGKLGISFYALNFESDFERLIEYFANEYESGRTPNPCVVCNQDLKFGKILAYADSIDADTIATGHYARIGGRCSSKILKRAVDGRKDQSYVLFGIERRVLERLCFPIGDLTKDQVRAEARRFGLPLHDKPDSVDICFVPDRDYARVVRERRPEAFRPGPVVNSAGTVVGRHDGVANYTIGQRRGLGLAMGRPIYVSAVDATENTVTIGPRQDLLKPGLEAERVNWLIDRPRSFLRVQAKIRYQHAPAKAVIDPRGEELRVWFDEPQMAITPGQAVVFYDGEDCLGGGWIIRALDEGQR